MRHWKLAIVLVLGMLIVGCARPAAQPATPADQVGAEPVLAGDISVAGSTTVQPMAELLAEAFMAQHADVEITVSGGGSSMGVKAAGDETVDVGMVSREVRQEELATYPDMQVIVIARDGIAVITHPDVAVNDLTVEQVRAIFAGEITNWQDVGGPDRMILVVSREEGAGTRAAFEEMVMGEDAKIAGTAILQPSSGAVRTTVATTPDSIGYLSFGYLDASVKALQIGGVEANVANAAAGTYPVVRPMNMVTSGEPTGLIDAWLDFILSAEGQQIVQDEGYLPVN